MSRGNLMDVPGCLCSKFTVWKEDQFTVLSGQGIKEWEKRVTEWVAKALTMAKSGVWGCVQDRVQWPTEEDVHMRPGHHCEFDDVGNSTEWRRMSRDSRSNSGHRMLTHHGHLWIRL